MRRTLAAVFALGCRATIVVPSGAAADVGTDVPVDDAADVVDAALPEDRPDVGRDVGTDALGPCSSGSVRCGATCVNLLNDSANCGECGRDCGARPDGGRWACMSDGRSLASAACASDVLDLALGTDHICIVRRSGEVQCWGYNASGQLGDETTTQRDTPSFVTGLGGLRMRSVYAGPRNTCASTEGGTVTYCWGDNEFGQLGIGTFGGTEPVTLRTQVRVLPSVSAFSLGDQHGCATDGSGLWCWGGNGYGQLGDATRNRTATPVAVTNSTGLLRGGDVATGYGRSFALDGEGAVWAWGNDNGDLGAGTGRGSSNVPVRVQGIVGVVDQVVAGQGHACARRRTGVSYCWGHNGFGEVGDGTTTSRAVATPVLDIQDLKWLYASASGAHTCAVDQQNRIYCWGLNDSGQLGDGTTTSRSRPTRAALDPGLTFYRVYLGGSMSCGLTTTFDAIWCWGDLRAIEPTVAARVPGSTRVLTPMRLTTPFSAGDGGV